MGVPTLAPLSGVLELASRCDAAGLSAGRGAMEMGCIWLCLALSRVANIVEPFDVFR